MKEILIYNLSNYGLFDKGYELYLRDFINNSVYFRSKYGTFYPPNDESHGEDDANSMIYSLDFKRFISQDECKFRKKTNIPQNYTINYNDKSNKTNKYFDIFRCMKNLKLEDFEKIKVKKFKFKNDTFRKEVENMVDRLLMKNKNIMLYLPKIIVGSDINDIISFINICLKDMLKFRSNYVKKDLYFTFIHKNNINENDCKFIVLQYKNDKLILVDMIDTKCSKHFS